MTNGHRTRPKTNGEDQFWPETLIWAGTMVETAVYDPVVVEPELTDSKVRELLTMGRESAKLDYKTEFDPSDTASKVDIVKDIMAMANTAGGYLVIGASDSGRPEGLQTEEAQRIDEAVVRAQVTGYTSGSIPIFVDNGVEYEDSRLVLITILPTDDSIVVVEADGNRPNKSPAFRKGDVLVRHGSASERWNQSDVDFLLRRIMQARKEKWLRDFGRNLRDLEQIRGTEPRSVGPAAYDLSAEDFQELVLTLARGTHG